ncbi:hypothetical protein LWI28_027605 [Acer negundo]|uniref:Uncharacterized protein n=1 Tax=Acer negundo TaxID=4023 RepID=A0AAD5J1M3_ACENE|nr:hypothetical protein LWI28_027605 [Acer negundo]
MVEFKVFKSDLQDISSVDCFVVDILQSECHLRNASEFFLSLFENKGEKYVLIGETWEKQTTSEISKLNNENANLMIEVETFRKERDEAIKKAKKLARLVEEQEVDFSHKTRKIQWQVELKDKTIDALKKESCKTENALRIAKVKECDYLAKLEKAENAIKILTKEQSIKGNVVDGVGDMLVDEENDMTEKVSIFNNHRWPRYSVPRFKEELRQSSDRDPQESLSPYCRAGVDLSTEEMKEPQVDIGINQWYSLYPSRGLKKPRGPNRARTEAEDLELEAEGSESEAEGSESEAKGSEPEAEDVEGAEKDDNVRLLTQMLKVLKATRSEQA